MSVLMSVLSIVSLGIVLAIGLLLCLAVRKLFEGTLRIPGAPQVVQPFRGPGVARGRGSRPWASGVREPRRPRSGMGSGSISLPEPHSEREREAG
jgi:hypothetical protein